MRDRESKREEEERLKDWNTEVTIAKNILPLLRLKFNEIGNSGMSLQVTCKGSQW